MKCPKCNNAIPLNSQECPECGIIIFKYLERQLKKLEDEKKNLTERVDILEKTTTNHITTDGVVNNTHSYKNKKWYKIGFIVFLLICLCSVGIYYSPLIQKSTGKQVDTATVKSELPKSSNEKKILGCISGDCINGYGTYIYTNHTKYEGQWKEGKIDGQGISYNENGQKIYEGQWKEEKADGQGILYNKNGIKLYEGNNKKGNREGQGITYYENGQKLYEGNYKESKRNGYGIFYNKNGIKLYEGQWKEDNMSGQGIAYYENGQKSHEGQFKEDKMNGQGILYNKNGQKVYEGQWLNNNPVDITTVKSELPKSTNKNQVSGCISGDCVNGYGTYIYPNNMKYEGQWKNNKKDGQGIFYYGTGQERYEGQWKEDNTNGQGILYNKNGQKVYEGEWKEGIPYDESKAKERKQTNSSTQTQIGLNQDPEEILVAGLWQCIKTGQESCEYRGLISFSIKGYKLLQMRIAYSDGSHSINKIYQTNNMFIVSGNTYGEYYELNNDRTLSVYDNKGFVYKMKDINAKYR